MNKHLLAVLSITLLALLLGVVLAACGGGTEPQDTGAPEETLDGKALVEERCTVCHGLDRTTGASKTQEEWKTTVERMVDKGANLNAQEQEAVIQYLAKTYGP